MTEQQYNEALAIYNPNGGHRPGKIYDLKGNDLTVVGGGGTRFNKDGSLELLEGSLFNLVTDSNDFSKWTIYNAGLILTPDTIKPPQGYSGGASLITESSGGDYHQIAADYGLISAGIYTASVFVKFIDSSRNVGLVPFNSSGAGHSAATIFNSNGEFVGTIGYAEMTNTTYNVETLADGWFRISVTAQATSDSDSVALTIRLYDGTSTTYLGNGTSGVYIYGSQFEIGNTLTPYKFTTTSGVMFPKIDYSTGKPAFLVEHIRTNYEPWSYDLTNTTSYIHRSLGTSTAVICNQVGITSLPNTATLVEDITTSDFAEVGHAFKAIAANSKCRLSVWIKKDSNQSRFPEIYAIFNTAGGNLETTLQLNTATGATAIRALNNSDNYVLDRGDWWEVVMISQQVAAQGKAAIRPALGQTLGTYTNTTTGSVIVGHIGVYAASRINEPPIITNGAAITTTRKILSGTISVPTSGFSLYLELENGSLSNDSSGLLWNKDGDSSSEILLIQAYVDGHYWLFSRGGTVNQASFTSSTYPVGENSKILITFTEGGGLGYFINGTKVHSVASGVISPKINNFISEYGTSYPFAGRIYDMRFSTPMTDSEAIALTTL